MGRRAVVIGSGPNGLVAAIELARAGYDVEVHEAAAEPGGGLRSTELTLPGFVHDVCSAIHPLAVASPALRDLDVDWVHPDAPLAHPLDDGTAVVLERSLEETARGLGRDATAYRRLMTPLVEDARAITDQFLGPLRPPRHPLAVARFGLRAIRSATGLANSLYEEERAKALFAGIAAHSLLSLRQPATAAYGLLLM